MIRQPALEVINYLKQADYNNPAVKYLLYGKPGSGKTMSLSHIIHYCHSQGWLIVQIPCGKLNQSRLLKVQCVTALFMTIITFDFLVQTLADAVL